MSSEVTKVQAEEGSGRPVEVTEQQAREVAEAARESRWDRPSFAKELYLGRFALDLVHPHPRAGEQDEERAAAFLAGLREVCDGFDAERIEKDARIPDEYLTALADIGAFGMKIPREYGGLGLTMSSYGKALMVVGSTHPSLGALLSAHQSIGVPEPVKLVGTQDQKARFLPRCAAGAVSAFLLTEPDVGSDPARMASTATPTADGDHPRAAQRVHGPARDRERPDPPAPGAGAGREPPGPRGRRAEDRADHAQRRSAVDPRPVRGRRQVVAQDRA